MHEIIILNVNNGDEFCYPCILLKGYIKNSSSHGSLPSFVEAISTNIQYRSVLNDFSFKIALELRVGENSITIKCCCSTTTLKLAYKPCCRKYRVLPLYIISDTQKVESAVAERSCRSINTVAKLLQLFVAEELFELGYGRKTFCLESCLVFKSKYLCDDILNTDQNEIWTNIAQEIMNSNIASNYIKYLAFMNCNIKKIALGTGGLALLDTSCLSSMPEKISDVIPHFTSSITTHCCGKSQNECFTYAFGSTLHELCHTFGLGHSHFGIMSSKYQQIKNFFIPEQLGQINPLEILASSYKTETLYLTKSACLFLGYHRWMNDYNFCNNHRLVFNVKSKFITSTAGLRVVEIRTEACETVLWEHTFPGRILKYSLGLATFLRTMNGVNMVVVAIDNVGNVIKQNIRADEN